MCLCEFCIKFQDDLKQLPEGQVKALIGHSKNMDTFGVYGHEMSGESKATAVAVNAIFERIVK